MRRYLIPRGTPSAGGVKFTGMGKICDDRLTSPFILEKKRYEIGPWLLWNVYRKHKWWINPRRFRWPEVTLKGGARQLSFL